MNPLPVIRAMIRANRLSFWLFTVLIALSVALGVALTAQERALRQGTARAVDKFDLIVAAPGSRIEIVLSTIFLQPGAVELIPGPVVEKLLADPDAMVAAPIAFGDSHRGMPVVGTTALFAEHISGGIAEGRNFARRSEAVVGAAVALELGHTFHAAHGHPAGGEPAHLHGPVLSVVGRLKPTASPWDRAIIVPVEHTWEVHGLPTGHPQDSELIGGPYAPSLLPGAPAVVLKPKSFVAAYGLRNRYRTAETTAFFPAEVLSQLYAVMGDVRQVMSYMTAATQVLVILAVVAGVIALMDLYRRRFAVLRAIGAPRSFILATIWGYLGIIVLSGSFIGLALGAGLAQVVSGILTAQSGVVFSPRIGVPELALAAMIASGGLVLAFVPALLQFRRPAIVGLKAD